MIEPMINGRYDRMLSSDLTGLRSTQVGTDVLILGRSGKTYLATTRFLKVVVMTSPLTPSITVPGSDDAIERPTRQRL